MIKIVKLPPIWGLKIYDRKPLSNDTSGKYEKYFETGGK